ncbi:MAG: hypothetical protein BWY04_01032 [candidate division CPR1 bacterium ADurb.Bin160]|uniref:Uncharacterized protein n=1 Tax=candidate division CPR1 bacterium ADurb.Bin160 TaxID=1852826 RepID=A0A1V5ZM50_9BACT|nr:MAG: hypothetical protein BWY04_01032 [candidate division CPR1 bacterium ADurb.Bin160]
MIITFPMLTSSTISPYVLPGICKVMEKALIAYNLDSIMQKYGGKYKRIYRAVNEGDVLDFPRGGTGGSQEPEVVHVPIPAPEGRREPTVSLYPGSGLSEHLSLEPTWIRFDTKKGTGIIGIKIIPMVVKSDISLGKLISDDINRKWLNTKITLLERKFLQLIYRAWKTFKIVSGIEIHGLTGDPKKDIIYATTKFGRDVLCAVDKADITSEKFKTVGIDRLFKLKWGSIVFCDEINKMAWFCLKDFKGICSQLSYTYLFSSIKSGMEKVYNDVAGVKKSASPFFRMKVPIRKIFGESLANTKMKQFSNILRESQKK